jgi:hypothetical protein
MDIEQSKGRSAIEGDSEPYFKQNISRTKEKFEEGWGKGAYGNITLIYNL